MIEKGDEIKQLAFPGFENDNPETIEAATVEETETEDENRTPQNIGKEKKKIASTDLTVVMEGPQNLSTIVPEKFRKAFLPIKNDSAYATYGASEYFSNLGVPLKSGKSDRIREIIGKENLTPEGERIINEGLSKIDPEGIATLLAFYAAARELHIVDPDNPDSENKELKIYIPGFWNTFSAYREQLDANHRPVPDIKQLYEYLGVLNKSTVIPFFYIREHNAAENTLTLEFPYFYALQKALTQESEVKTKEGKTLRFKKDVSCHVQADIFKSRNKYAPFIVTFLDAELALRGTVADSKLPANRTASFPSNKRDLVTYTVTFRKIVENTPLFNKLFYPDESGKYPLTATKNTILKNAFTTAYKLLREKTDLYTFYKELSITEVLPTSSTLDKEITITHRGIKTI